MIKKNNTKDLAKAKQEILDLKRTLLNLNFQKSTGQLEKTADIKKTKKNIAKLKHSMSKSIGVENA
tara:strand:- start:477 stop:674 length:198 start_codon:yes stop_codon:yes gene_type:complete